MYDLIRSRLQVEEEILTQARPIGRHHVVQVVYDMLSRRTTTQGGSGSAYRVPLAGNPEDEAPEHV